MQKTPSTKSDPFALQPASQGKLRKRKRSQLEEVTRQETEKGATVWTLFSQEIEILRQVLTGNARLRVYRHHIFFRCAQALLHAVSLLHQQLTILRQKQLDISMGIQENDTELVDSRQNKGEKQNKKRRSEENTSINRLLNKVKGFLLRTGENCTNEAIAQRVDTLPIALAILGVCARLDFLLSSNVLSIEELCIPAALHDTVVPRENTNEKSKTKNQLSASSSTRNRKEESGPGGEIELRTQNLISKLGVGRDVKALLFEIPNSVKSAVWRSPGHMIDGVLSNLLIPEDHEMKI